MPSPSPPSFSLYLLQEWFATLFARRLGPPACNADVVLSARHLEDLKQGILGTSEACDAGLLQQDEGSLPSLPCFILDSRAACHAASDMSLFSSPSFIKSWATASLPNRSHLPIIGVGTVSCDNFYLTDVLYVPGLRAGLNLVSVKQLAERGYLVMFGGGQCSVKERSGGRIVGKGRLHDDDGLYHLDFLTIP